MHNFKQAAIRVLIFVLIFSLICTAPMFMYFKYGSQNNNFVPELEKESGKIDFLFCGASQTVWSFIPNRFDELYGCNSFNISSGLLSMEGRYTILQETLKTNPVKTVVLDLSFGGLERRDETDTAEGEILLAEHLRGYQRFKYTLTHIDLDEAFYTFYYMFRTGLYSIVTRNYKKTVDSPLYGKGYWTTKREADMTGKTHWTTEGIPEKEPYAPSEESAEYLDKIMQLCAEKNIRVILVTTPYPTNVVSWSDRDGMLETHKALAEKYGTVLYDFNLYKAKDDLYDDKTSYFDVEHTSESGATITTTELAKLLLAEDSGVGKSDLFYNSYAEYIDNYSKNNAA